MRRSFLLWWAGAVGVVLVWSALGSRAAQARETVVVAAIDTRPPKLHEVFRRDFEKHLASALAGTPVRVQVRFENPNLAGIAAAVARLEAFAPTIYYATNSDIVKKVRAVNPRVPMVFSGVSEPRAAGIVNSIERPDDHLTGFVTYESVDGKRIELLGALNPRIKRIGIVLAEGTYAQDELDKQVAFGQALGLTVIPMVFPIDAPSGTVASLVRKHRLDAVDVPYTSRYVLDHLDEIVAIGRDGSVAMGFRHPNYVRMGGLLSYGLREFDLPKKAAGLVARILNGARTNEIPIEFPSEFDLGINLATAAKLPYAINKDILKRATVVAR